jgi:hypothetical protein
MADIPFQIGGTQFPCPDFSKSKFDELGDIAYEYLDGSPLYLGMPSVTYVWPTIKNSDVAAIRLVYDALVAGLNPLASSGTPVSLTVPDYKNGGLRTTTAYMLEPTGTAGGDLTTNFSVTFTQLHEGSFQTAIASPAGNDWEIAANGGNLQVGSAQYPVTGWQF